MEVTNREKDAGVSLLETISEKGHNLISKFVKGFFTTEKPKIQERFQMMKAVLQMKMLMK